MLLQAYSFRGEAYLCEHESFTSKSQHGVRIDWPVVTNCQKQWTGKHLSSPQYLNQRQGEKKIWSDVYCGVAMTNQECSNTTSEPRHQMTCVVVHSFHHRMCNRQSFPPQTKTLSVGCVTIPVGNISVFNFFMYPTCFEPRGSSSGRLYTQLWYDTFQMRRYKQSGR
jgi:hypothetical protein